MKNTFKKIVSLALTVLMVAGMFTMLVPMTASAEEAEPIYLKKNETATINGITYRFDTKTPDDEKVWARVNPDGTWEVSIRNGDMLWFPDIELTDSSEIYAEVTNALSGPVNHFPGLAYGVVSSTDSAYTETNVAVVRTYQNSKARFRATSATRDQIVANNGEGKKVTNWEVAENSAWTSIKGSNSNWGGKKTVYHKISQTSDKVVLEFGTPDKGAFADTATTSYDRSTAGVCAYAGGSVGYTMVWCGTDPYQFIIDDIQITNCKVAGADTDFYSVSGKEPHKEPVYLEKNKTETINGVTYRFDVVDGNSNSWARVNPDGTWDVSIRNGDMLWFPDIELTDSSEIYAEVTNLSSGPVNYFPGFAYGVVSTTKSTYTESNVAVVRTYQNNQARFRATGATRSQIVANGGAGNKVTNWEVPVNDAWNAVKGSNSNWGAGKTVYHKISQTSDKVVLEFGAPGVGAFADTATTSYDRDAQGMNAYAGGSVGYTMVWCGDDNWQFRIEDINITNCKVKGVEKASYSVKALAPTVDKEAKISLSLDGTIGLNFSINAKNLKDAAIVATKEGVEVVNQAVVDGENVVTVPVAAKEMTDDVNFSIMVDGVVFEDHSYTTSVAAYAAELKKNADWAELMGAMLNYGAAAQKLLNYKADALAPDASADVDYDFTSFKAVEFSGDKSILAGLFINLSLESDTTLKIYVKMADGTMPTVTVNGKAADLTDNGDGYYILAIDGIAADKLDDDFAIVVNGQLSFGVNALDWARLADNNADEDVANAARALAAYGEAAGKKF